MFYGVTVEASEAKATWYSRNYYYAVLGQLQYKGM
jgi:hypothetical protein